MDGSVKQNWYPHSIFDKTSPKYGTYCGPSTTSISGIFRNNSNPSCWATQPVTIKANASVSVRRFRARKGPNASYNFCSA